MAWGRTPHALHLIKQDGHLVSLSRPSSGFYSWRKKLARLLALNLWTVFGTGKRDHGRRKITTKSSETGWNSFRGDNLEQGAISTEKETSALIWFPIHVQILVLTSRPGSSRIASVRRVTTTKAPLTQENRSDKGLQQAALWRLPRLPVLPWLVPACHKAARFSLFCVLLLIHS
jgi:hypothetical protein